MTQLWNQCVEKGLGIESLEDRVLVMNQTPVPLSVR